MRTIRLERIPYPKDKKNLVLGDIRNGLMHDCIFNSIIQGDYDDWEAPHADVSSLLSSYPYIGDAKLKPYQIEDLSKALGLNNVFNINKPGYGKTLETILWIKLRLKKNFKALILCPKSVIGSWEDQLKRFWPECYQEGMWWITNYEQLYNKERYARAMCFEWDVIVLDESHTIKSMKSKITSIVFDLRAKFRHCLTGTPIKNRPEDLASQLKWLDPYSITNFTDFQNMFCQIEEIHGHPIPRGLTKNKERVELLQKLLDLFCVGGQEHDIGLINEPEFIKVKLDLDKKVKALYTKVVGEYDKESQSRIIDTEGLLHAGIKVTNPIEAATRRQQLTSNPQLFDPQLKNVKFEWIAEWLEGTDEKVVIFSKYAQSIQALESYLRTKHFKVTTIKREQTTQMRQLQLKQWKMQTQVLLGTFGVLSAGVDGLQEVCHYVIFLDREWTASDNQQAEGRIVRTGQKHQPIIYILQAKGTIDVQIERIQLDKGHDAAELLAPVIE